MNPNELSPHYIRAIAPYQPGKPIGELAREMGLDEADIVKLASNENPLGIGPLARAAIARARRHGPHNLRLAYEYLLEADRTNKLGEVDEDLTIEILVMKLCALAPAAAGSRR